MLEIKKGEKFGMLTIVREVPKKFLPSGQTNRAFECVCECGVIKEVRMLHLRRGSIYRCGRCNKPLGQKKEEYPSLKKIWRAIKYRCSESYFESHLYYKKGIKVCELWKNDWISFREWGLQNGYIKGLHIDREDNSKGYSPDNCRWVTCKVNANNRDNTFMVNYNGTLQPIMIVGEKLNMSLKQITTIRRRILKGWNHQKAFDTPIRKGNYKTKNI